MKGKKKSNLAVHYRKCPDSLKDKHVVIYFLPVLYMAVIILVHLKYPYYFYYIVIEHLGILELCMDFSNCMVHILACSFNCYLLCTSKTKRTKQISSNLQPPSSLPPPPPKVIDINITSWVICQQLKYICVNFPGMK